MAKKVSKKVVKKVSKPTAKKTKKTTLKKVKKPIARKISKPTSKKVNKPTKKKVNKPTIKKVNKSVTKKVETKKIVKPVVKEAKKPEVKKTESIKVNKPIEKKVNKPIAKKVETKPVEKQDAKFTVVKRIVNTNDTVKSTPIKKVEPKKETIEVSKVILKKEPPKKKTALDRAIDLYNSEPYVIALNQLQSLRKDGDWKILKIKDENIDVRINKQITKEGKKKLLDMNNKEMNVAKAVSVQNRSTIKTIVKDISIKSNKDFKPIFEEAKRECLEGKVKAKAAYKLAIKRAKEEYASDLKVINSNKSNSKTLKVDLNAAKISYKSKLNAAKSAKFDAIQKAKELRYQTYQTSYEYFTKARLNKHTESENRKYGYETYIRNFNFATWLTKNALFLIVGVVFLVMLTMMGIAGSISTTWFLNALTTIAPKIFFALGVAGLILLAGTDLSIGRLTAVGSSFTLMILTDTQNSLTWFPHLYMAPLPIRVVVALVVSIALCTLFTSISGFFTAKFKMHPFISTLAIQLIVYGFFQTFFSSVSAFTISTSIQETLAGKGGWLLIVYAALAILVVWFIWNKTKFGKNLYAVGGNPEAAAVSGINPFKITMLAFVMAGVLYGLGGFVQGLQGASSNFTSYNGTETDAIAACVIGGISFSGGVGSILGAVGGAVILGFLTSCFNALEIDTNIQFVIKGLIILIAVTLDCVKYIRKK